MSTDAEKLFSDLNEELAKSGLTLDLLCVGGFVLEYHNMRSTDDIDAFYQESSDLIECIENVGRENGIKFFRREMAEQQCIESESQAARVSLS